MGLHVPNTTPRLTDAVTAATSAPSSVAIDVPRERRITYAELVQLVDDAAKRLEALGLAQAGRVALIAPNSADTLITLLALSGIAATVPLNPAYTRSEIRSRLQASGARVLVVPHEGRGPWDDAGIPVVRWKSSNGHPAAAAMPSRDQGCAFLFSIDDPPTQCA